MLLEAILADALSAIIFVRLYEAFACCGALKCSIPSSGSGVIILSGSFC